MQKETKIFIGVLFIVAIGIIVLRTPDQQEIAGTVVALESPGENPGPTGETREYDIRIYRYGYDPKTITANQGDRIRLELTSLDTPHGFAIVEYGISEYVRPGATSTVEFVVDKTGSFRYYCNVPCGSGHRNMGGELIVK